MTEKNVSRENHDHEFSGDERRSLGKRESFPSMDDLRSLGPRRQMDRIFEAFSDELFHGHQSGWSRINCWLDDVDPKELSLQNIIAVLSITLPIRDQVWRKSWATKAEIVVRHLTPGRADRLLAGLL